MPPPELSDLLRVCVLGYLFSISVETPILMVGLSQRHAMRRRFFAGLWLTACTYPIVSIVFFTMFEDRTTFLWVAETFAPVAECALFWAAFGERQYWNTRSMWRDFLVITLANLAS